MFKSIKEVTGKEGKRREGGRKGRREGKKEKCSMH